MARVAQLLVVLVVALQSLQVDAQCSDTLATRKCQKKLRKKPHK